MDKLIESKAGMADQSLFSSLRVTGMPGGFHSISTGTPYFSVC
jgi:hypothetical protein